MFPWEDVPEFVVGRPGFDTWLVRTVPIRHVLCQFHKSQVVICSCAIGIGPLTRRTIRWTDLSFCLNVAIGVGAGGARGAIVPPLFKVGGLEYLLAPPLFGRQKCVLPLSFVKMP